MTQTQKQNVPKLRFPGFERAWEASFLGKQCDITTGRLDANAMIEDGQYPFFTCARDVYKIDTPAFDTEALLISGNGANVGYIHYYNGKFNAYQRTYVLDGFTQDIRFIQRNLERGLKKRIFSEVKEGNTPYIVKGTLADMPINLPSLPEQRKIAHFLGAVDEKIAHLSRKKALLEDYKKGCMQQLFSQKIRFKDDDGNDFPDWEEKRLEQVANINPKSGPLPETFLYIDLESVSRGQLTDPKQETSATAPSRAQRLLAANDTLFQLVRPYQRNNYFFPGGEIHVASTGYAVLRARESPKFLYQAVHEDRFVNRVLERCTGTNYPAINSNDLAKIQLTIPHPAEQRKIADFLSALDRKIDLVAQELTHARSFKAGLLQQMFI